MKYRKKPIEIEAIQFIGTEKSCSEVGDFLGGPYSKIIQWNLNTLTGGTIMVGLHGDIMLATERWVGFSPGCWIVKSAESICVMTDEDFNKHYENVPGYVLR